MRYVMLTDTPAPWREKVFEHVHGKLKDDFHVVYCNTIEDHRSWIFSYGKHKKTMLNKLRVKIRKKERYINFGIIKFLLKYRPKILIWFQFQPTMILALLIAKILQIKLIVLSDTWIERDKPLTFIQKMGRSIVYNNFSDAFIGASKKTIEMYKHYNKRINKKSCFLSHLCADNDYFDERIKKYQYKKDFDIMFSGRIAPEKNPKFLVDVAIAIKEKLGKCKVLIIGDGDDVLKKEMIGRLEDRNVDYLFAGFISHDKLPNYYGKSKILLLPTSGDCWGVVINEAMISGLPVITTSMTAAAGELVIEGKNGHVLPLIVDVWAERITELLTDKNKLDEFSNCAIETVKKFNFQKAAQGIISSIEYLEN